MFGLDINCTFYTCVCLYLTSSFFPLPLLANSDVNGASEYSNLCPFNKCPSGSTQLYSTSDCCQPCMCEGSCVADNCCPGVQRHPTVKAYCRSQHEMYNVGRVQADILLQNDYEWLYVVDHCRNDIPQLAQHQARCEKPSKLEDYVIVMNSNGSALFKNDQCAKCNGVLETVKWSLAYYDTVNVNQRNISVLNNTFHRENYIAFSSFPPLKANEKLMRIHLCSSNDMIDTCSLKPPLNSTDEGRHAKTMCESTHQSEFGLYFSEGMIFKNIYCALCVYKKYKCSSIIKNNDFFGLVSVPFYVILDFTPFTHVWTDRKDILTQEHRCDNSKFFDPMTVKHHYHYHYTHPNFQRPLNSSDNTS